MKAAKDLGFDILALQGNNNPDQVEINNNGERMLAWCFQNIMKIMNSIFRTKRIHRETWRNPATGKWKRVDYICVSPWVTQFVKSYRVYIAPSRLFDTDHQAGIMNIEFPTTKKVIHNHLNKSKHHEAKPTKRYEMTRN